MVANSSKLETNGTKTKYKTKLKTKQSKTKQNKIVKPDKNSKTRQKQQPIVLAGTTIALMSFGPFHTVHR